MWGRLPLSQLATDMAEGGETSFEASIRKVAGVLEEPTLLKTTPV